MTETIENLPSAKQQGEALGRHLVKTHHRALSSSKSWAASGSLSVLYTEDSELRINDRLASGFIHIVLLLSEQELLGATIDTHTVYVKYTPGNINTLSLGTIGRFHFTQRLQFHCTLRKWHVSQDHFWLVTAAVPHNMSNRTVTSTTLCTHEHS